MELDALRDLLAAPLLGVHLFIWITLLGNLLYLRRTRRSEDPDDWPSVAVCIPARNEERNLQRLLPSLLEQDYPNLDIHVWDDGSEDGTWDVLQSVDDERVHAYRGDGPPSGWVGKVHALYQLTRRAAADRFVFLDADAELEGPAALRRLVSRFEAQPRDSVASALPRLRGKALLMVSLVPNAILAGLPWPLVRLLPLNSLGALNGQCWIIRSADYHEHEPHEAVREEVLEDVEIGRYLKSEGLTPVLLDLRDTVSVYMYESFGEAWRGFRKNAYLILGGSVWAFPPLWIFFLATWVLAPVVSLWFLASVYGLKFVTDRLNRFSPALTALAPASYLLGSVLQFDSAVHHWTDRVSWKGRTIHRIEGET